MGLILQNPRSHTGRGYRHQEDRLPDRNRTAATTMEDEVADDEIDDDAIFDQDVVQDADTYIDDTVSIANNTDTDTTTTTTTTKYYAKNETYNFQTQGHSN